jgi:protein-L-isoaspartate(D-aspartate) O-methyltransferase
MSENTDIARYNMIQQQIRPCEISDLRVVHLLEKMHREDYVPSAYKKMAFFDMHIPLDGEQAMMKPVTEAKVLQALDIQATDKIMEIGTGTGFMTACLAALGQHVFSSDTNQTMTDQAQQHFDAHGIKNISLSTENSLANWDSNDQFDVISFSGSIKSLPDEWKNRLKIGGRMLVFMGNPTIAEAILITRTGKDQWQQKSVFDAYTTPLEEPDTKAKFIF